MMTAPLVAVRLQDQPQHKTLRRLVGPSHGTDSAEVVYMDADELPVDAAGEAVSGVPADPNDPRLKNQTPAGCMGVRAASHLGCVFFCVKTYW